MVVPKSQLILNLIVFYRNNLTRMFYGLTGFQSEEWLQFLEQIV